MKIRTEVKIGFIVLATILLVIYGINYLKGKNVLKRTDVYYAVFKDISGLQLSSPIFISGMKIGLINDIDFPEDRYDRIQVAMAINKGIKIPENSIVELYSSDIMGNKALRIIPSSEKALASYGDTLDAIVQMDIISNLQSQLDPFKEKISVTLSGLDSLLKALNNVLTPASQKNLQLMISNLEESTGSLNAQLGKGGKLQQTIDNLNIFSKMLSDNKDRLNTVFQNVEEITDSIAVSNLKSAIANLDQTLDQTRKLMSSINQGEGSLGLLATNDSLYKNLESATSHLSILLEDLEKNPKRYVHFSIFGKKDRK